MLLKCLKRPLGFELSSKAAFCGGMHMRQCLNFMSVFCSLILTCSRKIILDMWEELLPYSTILLSKNLGQTFIAHHESAQRVSNLNFIVYVVIRLTSQYYIIHLVQFFPKCKAYSTGTARDDFKQYCKIAVFNTESWWESYPKIFLLDCLL